MFTLSNNSLAKLHGVHYDLVNVVKLAISITDVDFVVVQGLRTPEQEAALVAKGASETMHSRHLPNTGGFACAVDLAAFVENAIAWKPVSLYQDIARAMQSAAHTLKVPLEWGGDWTSLKDYGHFQLPWAVYP